MSAFHPRSRSSDSSATSPCSFDISRKTCAKRGHSHNPTSTDGGLRKRRRRDHSLHISESLHRTRKPCLFMAAIDDLVSKPAFATTSAQFNLFPRQAQRVNPPRQFNFDESRTTQLRSSGHLDDLTKLRSAAFWELRQSVAENGEGLVHRMREYERSRSRHQAHQRARDSERRGRKRSAWRARNRASLPIQIQPSASDDDDTPSHRGISFERTPEGRVIVRPVESMDIDFDDEPLGVQHTSYSSDTHSSPSIDIPNNISGDEDEDEDTVFINNSCVSAGIANDIKAPEFDSSPSSSHSTSGSPSSSVTSFLSSKLPEPYKDNFQYPFTSSEKAVAALNIAFANGAGSISDYSPVWEYQRRFNFEGHDHGDLWR